jgi:anti-sigma-K factor RskA
MTCEERRDQILLYSADALDAAERAAVVDHLRSGCPRCAGSLAEAEAVLAQLPWTLTPVTPSDEVRRRLMRRVESDARSVVRFPVPVSPAPPAGRPERRGNRWLGPLVAAAVAASLVYALMVVPFSRESVALRADLASQSERIRSLESQVEQQAETARLLQSREAIVATLAGSEPQPEAWGRIVWDRAHKTVHFYTGNLKPLQPGRVYELWLITEGQEKIPAGTFEVDPSKQGQLVTRLTQDVGNVVLAAVTEEPAGGVPQPTGAIQLAGKLVPAS